MRHLLVSTTVLMILSTLFTACSQGEKLPDTRTPLGVPYTLHNSEGGQKPQEGDYIGIHMRYISESDSTFFNSYTGKPLYYAYTPPKQYGDPMDWIRVLGVGDSATFFVEADSVFRLADPPSYIRKGSRVKAIMRLVEITDLDGFKKEEARTNRARLEPEIIRLKKRLDAKGISYDETDSGVLYSIEHPGANAPVPSGMKVKVHYTGTLLNGEVFDSSRDRGPFEFVINESQVIQGWHLGIPLFGEGGKGTIYLIPSLSYGNRATGNIPANSDLIFDIEVLKVIDPLAKVREEAQRIEAYLARNNISNWQRTDDFIYYVVQEPGTGAQPSAGRQVSVHYTGRLLNGTKFDSSVDRGQPFTFTIGQGQVIRGWDLGIPLFRVGGKGTLYLPSSLAYGEQQVGDKIAPNSILMFDVEVLDVQ